jgi:hypothetical protein
MVDIATRTTVHDKPTALRAPPVPATRTTVLKRVAWQAIFAGAAVTIGCQLIFTMLGAGIGLASIRPAYGDDPTKGMAIGAGIWWLVTGLISLFIGGMVTGRLAGLPQKVDALLHGVLMWCVTAILGVYVLTTSAASLISGAFGPVAQGYAQSAANNPVNNPNSWSVDRTGSGIAVTGPNSFNTTSQPGSTDRDFRTSESSTLSSSSRVDGADRDGNPTIRGEKAVRDPVTGKVITESEARAAADKAARALAAASLWSFFALVLGVCAAGMGATMARPLAAGTDPSSCYFPSDTIDPNRPYADYTLPERRPPE